MNEITIVLKSPYPEIPESRHRVDPGTATVGDIRSIVSEKCGSPLPAVRLIFGGKILTSDPARISEVLAGRDFTIPHTFHFILSVSPASSARAAAPQAPQAPPPPQPPRQQQQHRAVIPNGLQLGFLLKLGFFFFLVARGSSRRLRIVGLCCAVLYLYVIGVVPWVWRELVAGFAVTVPRRAPRQQQSFARVFARVFAPFFLSLFPSWDPRTFAAPAPDAPAPPVPPPVFH